MTELASLVRWIIVYAVNGGFWHFLAVYLIVVAIARIFRFVRVDVKVDRKTEKAASE